MSLQSHLVKCFMPPASVRRVAVDLVQALVPGCLHGIVLGLHGCRCIIELGLVLVRVDTVLIDEWSSHLAYQCGSN